MKILQINCVYKAGSTGKITYDIHQSLKNRGIESVVYYGRGENHKEPGTHKICSEVYGKAQNVFSRFTGIRYGGCLLSTRKLMRCIKKEKPDIVHLQCINGHFVNIYQLIEWLKKERIKTVLTLHAEFMHTANCSHAMECEQWKTGCKNCPRPKAATKTLWFNRTRQSYQKMQKAFEGFEKDLKVISVSPWLEDRAKQSMIMKPLQHQTIFNGIDTDIFCVQEAEDLRKKYDLLNKKCVFHATAHFTDEKGHPKGGEYIIRLAEAMKEKGVVYLVAGDYQVKAEVPETLIFLGKVKDQRMLAAYYSMADVSVITSKRETFSMPCAESLCCGTPMVGFLAGGPERIALKEYSEFVEYDDFSALEQCVEKWLNKGDTNKEEISEKARECYGKDMMVNRYVELYRRILNG